MSHYIVNKLDSNKTRAIIDDSITFPIIYRRSIVLFIVRWMIRKLIAKQRMCLFENKTHQGKSNCSMKQQREHT